jgi:hypothetical protein
MSVKDLCCCCTDGPSHVLRNGQSIATPGLASWTVLWSTPFSSWSGSTVVQSMSRVVREFAGGGLHCAAIGKGAFCARGVVVVHP